MKFDDYSNAELAHFIAQASIELSQRLKLNHDKEPDSNVVAAPQPEPVLRVEAPAQSVIKELEAVLSGAKGGYIKSDRKDWYREIAKEFPDYFAFRKWPDSLRGNIDDWKKFGRI